MFSIGDSGSYLDAKNLAVGEGCILLLPSIPRVDLISAVAKGRLQQRIAGVAGGCTEATLVA